MESIYPYIGDERKVNIPKEDLIVLLTNNDPQKSPPIVTLSKIVQDQVQPLSKLSNCLPESLLIKIVGPGSCVLIYTEESEVSGDSPMQLHISGWRGTTSLRCYTMQHSTIHLLRLLGGDVSKYGKLIQFVKFVDKCSVKSRFD